MKKYTFEIANNNTFHTNNNTTNYSEIIDNLILSSIKKNNEYLFETPKKSTCNLCKNCPFSIKKNDNTYKKAIDFLLNYKNKKINTLPFKLNTIYYINGKAICFFDDEIQIESDIYSYDDFNNFDFINALTPAKKKIIIDIYTKSNCDIEINF